MLLLWVVLLIVFLWIFFPMGQGDRFKKYEHLVHPYSGLDPESWSRFLVNMKTLERLVSTSSIDEAASALYSATENIKDIGLALRRSDDANIQEELTKIAGELGYEGEFILNKNAIAKGIYFFPRYLNESLLDYSENADTRDPGPVRNHGQ